MLKRLFNGYFWGYVKAVALRIAVAEDDEEEEENTRITPNYYANGTTKKKKIRELLRITMQTGTSEGKDDFANQEL